MAIQNYSPDNFVLAVNGRELTSWGEAALPYTDEPIDPKSTLRRGQGGTGVRMNRTNPGRRVTIYLNPGSPDSAYMQGLFNSNANISLNMQMIGTLEVATGTEGVIVNDGPVGRGGTTNAGVTDDMYVMEFNLWTALKGGDN